MLPIIVNSLHVNLDNTQISNFLLTYDSWKKPFKLKSEKELSKHIFTLERKTKSFFYLPRHSTCEIKGTYSHNQIEYQVSPNKIVKSNFILFPIIYPVIFYLFISSDSVQYGQLIGFTIFALLYMGFYYFRVKRDSTELYELFKKELTKLI